MASQIRTFRDLEVWQRAIDLSLVAYTVSEKLPTSERFGLTSQIRRASTSVSANIAEGHELRGKSYLRHVRSRSIGRRTRISSAHDQAGFLRADVLANAESARVGRMLNGLWSLGRRLIVRPRVRQRSCSWQR
jgi:hypothetical protein